MDATSLSDGVAVVGAGLDDVEDDRVAAGVAAERESAEQPAAAVLRSTAVAARPAARNGARDIRILLGSG
ncbi:MAG: hypothetical protein ABIO16_09340 [Nocardioides sp.]